MKGLWRDNYGYLRDWVVFWAFALAVVLVMGLLLVGAFFGSRWSCNRLEDQSGYPTRYTISNGCLIKIDGRYIPKDQWRQLT